MVYKKSVLAIAATAVLAVILMIVFGDGPRDRLFDKIKKIGVKPAAEKQDASVASEPANASSSGQEEEPPTVEIPENRQHLIGAKTTEVAVRHMEKVIRTVGRIEYDERKIFTVNTRFEGWIEKLYVDYSGRYVKKGEPLAEVYSPELFATQQEFINALKWSRTPVPAGASAESEFGKRLANDSAAVVAAARQRLRLWDITDEQIKKIGETGEPVRTLTIFSPVSGYVVQKAALQGMRVMPGEKLFDIADLSTLWIISDVYEYEIPFVRVGESARISLSYLPGKEFVSKIDYVYPTLAGETRTAKVRFSIPNRNGQLKPQMFANVEVKLNLGRKLAIPSDSVIDTGERQVVYVDQGDGYFEPREVMLGISADGLREVLKGLKAGDKIASSAAFLIDSEAQLKGVTPLKLKNK